MRTILAYPPAAAGASPSSRLPPCRAFRVHGLDGKRLLARLTDEGGAVLGELLLDDSSWIDLGDAGTGLWWLEALAGEDAPSSVAVTYVPRSSSLEAGWMVPAPIAQAFGYRTEVGLKLTPADPTAAGKVVDLIRPAGARSVLITQDTFATASPAASGSGVLGTGATEITGYVEELGPEGVWHIIGNPYAAPYHLTFTGNSMGGTGPRIRRIYARGFPRAIPAINAETGWPGVFDSPAPLPDRMRLRLNGGQTNANTIVLWRVEWFS